MYNTDRCQEIRINTERQMYNTDRCQEIRINTERQMYNTDINKDSRINTERLVINLITTHVVLKILVDKETFVIKKDRLQFRFKLLILRQNMYEIDHLHPVGGLAINRGQIDRGGGAVFFVLFST